MRECGYLVGERVKEIIVDRSRGARGFEKHWCMCVGEYTLRIENELCERGGKLTTASNRES